MGRMSNNPRVIFFGTSDFASHLLKDIHRAGINLVAVVTRPDRPNGRNLKLSPSFVKQYHQSSLLNIPLHQPEKVSTAEFEELLRTYQPDLFVVAAFGEIIKINILNIPPLGSINVHPSLLPKYRGPSPLQSALLQGDLITGVCIIEVGPKMDAGDIYAMQEIAIDPNENFTGLQAKALSVASPMLIEVIQFKANGACVGFRQNESDVTFCKKIKPEDEKIEWSEALDKVHNKIRALSERPGAWSYIQIGDEVKRVKIYASELYSSVEAKNFLNKKNICISKDEYVLRITKLQLEGKKVLTSEQFLSGLRLAYTFK